MQIVDNKIINKKREREGRSHERSSNLELYRIVCMLMIVAHHYVVNSGFTGVDGPLTNNPDNLKTYFLYLFGMWGKTGINCFLMITGYFMCTSRITLKKFLKLLLEVYFYKIIIFAIFAIVGREPLTLVRFVKILFPVWGFETDFVSCFIAFFLTIPFLNILIRNMNKCQHLWLLILLLGMYSICGTIPTFDVAINYVTWFGVIYLIAAYIRLYPTPIMDKKCLWGWLSLLTIVISMASVVLIQYVMKGKSLGLMVDSNKLFPVVVAICSFLWFKNLKIPQSKIINLIGGSTFGVLLLHANSSAMRQWLWKDTIDCVGHYDLPIVKLIGFSVIVVLAIFFSCIIIDRIRIRFIETPFFNKFSSKFDRLENRIFSSAKSV